MGLCAPLPVIISVPHGGTEVPEEARPHCRLDMQAILKDGDTWSRELYALREPVAGFIASDIARAIIDMNRAPGDLPPGNPDGIVKTVTVEKVQVWDNQGGPPDTLAAHLVRTYHGSYHRKLQEFSDNSGALFGIDCHTMLPFEPGKEPGEDTRRPLICISNRGGFGAEEKGEPLTAPADLVLALRDALRKEFIHESVEFTMGGEPVGVNNPFRGGYIIRTHGWASSIPWVQFEINRALYMPCGEWLPENPDRKTLKRLSDLRDKFVRGIKSIL